MHTYTHTYIHTYIRTYIHAYSLSPSRRVHGRSASSYIHHHSMALFYKRVRLVRFVRCSGAHRRRTFRVVGGALRTCATDYLCRLPLDRGRRHILFPLPVVRKNGVERRRRLGRRRRHLPASEEDSAALVSTYPRGQLPMQRAVARGSNGCPLLPHQLEVYDESKIRCGRYYAHKLINHIMWPRPHRRSPEVVRARAEDILVAYCCHVAPGLPVSRCCLGVVSVVVGTAPQSHSVKYHGAHPGAVRGIIDHSLQARTCLRRCEERSRMGNRLITTEAYGTASRWSQYVDVGVLTIGRPIGWFTNVVCIIHDPSGVIQHASTGRFYPAAFAFELKKESELYKANKWISPYACELI